MNKITENAPDQDTESTQSQSQKHAKLIQLGVPIYTPSGFGETLRETLSEQAEYVEMSEADKAAASIKDTLYPEHDSKSEQSDEPSQADSLSIGKPAPTKTDLAKPPVAAIQDAATQDAAMQGSNPEPVNESDAWAELRARVAHCERCALHETRKQSVFGAGDPNADWLVIGEAPGAEEDASGEAFVGRAGKLLNSMMASLGLSREHNLFIANILKSRPPNNRDPLPDEIDACWPYLAEQTALIQPKIIIAVGRIAAHRLIGEAIPMGELRGKVHWIKIDANSDKSLPLIVTYHPAYLMRSPSQKAKAWDDLRLAWQTYQSQLASE